MNTSIKKDHRYIFSHVTLFGLSRSSQSLTDRLFDSVPVAVLQGIMGPFYVDCSVGGLLLPSGSLKLEAVLAAL